MKKWLVVIMGITIFAAQGMALGVSTSGCAGLVGANMPELSTLLPANLQAELAPYLASSTQWSKDTGMPVVRPVCADFPRDEEATSVTDEYMVGPGLMVAPSTNGESHEVYLPLARWYDYWTGKVIGGGRSVSFDAAEGPTPIYVRGSSIIPTAEAGTNNIVFRVYAGYAPASCTLCPTGGEGCSIRAARSPNGMEILVNPGLNCPQKSATFVINLPYRTVASMTVDGQTLPRLPSEQLSGAAQGWNQEGTIVRIKIPVAKKTLVRMSYTI